MVLDIMYNIALLLSVGAIFSTIRFKYLRTAKIMKMLEGVIIGVIGLLIMSRPVPISQGVVVDSRTILIGTTAMFFGPFSSAIATLMMIIFRISRGGSGMLTGIFSPLVAWSIGSLWHHWRFEHIAKSQESRPLEFLLVGFIIHLGFIATLWLLPAEQRSLAMHYLVLAALTVFPVGSYLLSTMLYTQLQSRSMVERLYISQQWFKTLFDQAPVGITVTDTKNRKAIEVNDKYLQIVGMERQQIRSISWEEVTHPDDLEQDLQLMGKLMAGLIDSYTIEKRLLTGKGTYIWINMAVSRLQESGSEDVHHLCMIQDISERKEIEQAILYANTHDNLTSLYNRSAFEQLTKEQDRVENYPLAIIVGDINGLKIINDAFGSEEGDRVLQSVANRIQTVIGPSGSCARLGGDEFGILIPRCSKEEAYRLVAIIQESSSYGQAIELSLSFGAEVKVDASESLQHIFNSAENSMNRSKLSESPSARSKAVHTIISTLHEKNKREEFHSRRVGDLSAQLGQAYGLSTKEIQELKTVGLLHDIGKIAVDESILNKKGKLDQKEWEAIRRHPEIGWKILSAAGELGEFASIVLAHHERIDGRGYPQGLTGEQIPLAARMIAIADAFDAMTATRSYKEAIGENEAASELKRCAGTQFDKHLAQVFVEQVLHLDWEAM